MSERERAAQAYIRRLRNRAKRAYAEAYLASYSGAPEPFDWPGLSYMAAQSVRHNLWDIFGCTPDA